MQNIYRNYLHVAQHFFSIQWFKKYIISFFPIVKPQQIKQKSIR